MKMKLKEAFRDRDFVMGLIFVMLAILGYYYSVVYIYSIAKVGVAPDFYPKLLFVLLGFSGLTLMIESFKREEKKPFPKYNWKLLTISIALIVGYGLLFERVGFIISTIIFVFVFMLVLHERKPLNLILVPVVTALAIYFLFTKGFMIVLP